MTPACSHIQCPDFIGFSVGAMTVLMLHFFYLEDIYIYVDLAPGFCEESAGIMLLKCLERCLVHNHVKYVLSIHSN